MPDRHGPYRNSRFIVEIDGVATASFNRVDLPETGTTVRSYRDGNDPSEPRLVAGRPRTDPLVLENGVTEDSIALFEWYQLVAEGKVDEARRSVVVTILDEEGEPGPRWEFTDAWPARYAGPTLDADDSDGIAVERLEVVHEEMERVQ